MNILPYNKLSIDTELTIDEIRNNLKKELITKPKYEESFFYGDIFDNHFGIKKRDDWFVGKWTPWIRGNFIPLVKGTRIELKISPPLLSLCVLFFFWLIVLIVFISSVNNQKEILAKIYVVFPALLISYSIYIFRLKWEEKLSIVKLREIFQKA